MGKKKLIITLLFLVCLLCALPLAASAYQSEWVKEEDGSEYYYGENGEKYTGGPKSIRTNGKTYLYIFDAEGRLIKNKLVRINDRLCLSLANGRLLTTAKKVNGKIYYGSSSGYLNTGLQSYKGNFYFFKKSTGAALIRTVKKIGNYHYFFKANGTAARSKFCAINGKKYYFDKDGHRVYGIQKIGKYYYGFHLKYGSMQYGWKKANGKHYYFLSNGHACAGNMFYKIGSDYFYFNSRGERQTGWLVVGEKRYYLDPKNNGARVTGKKTIDGVTYDFGTNGYVTYTKYGMKVLRVNRQKCVVTVYENNVPVKAMTCSVGLNGATPVGTFTVGEKKRWWVLNGPTTGQYCTNFLPNYLFHSVPMSGTAQNPYNVSAHKFNMLGQPASEGCIRLCVRDAKWIYDNVPSGSKVIISDGEPTPLGKPVLPKMKEGTTGKDPTDIWS